MNEILRNSIDDALAGILKTAHATTCVDRMVKVSGERMTLDESRFVYYRAPHDNAPLFISFHSGGFLFGGAALNDSMWTRMALELGVNIASVSYLKAPGYKWRDTLKSAFEGFKHIAGNADLLGFDPGQISLFGCSAGGNLAASVCMLNSCSGYYADFDHTCDRDINIQNLIMLYPLLDLYTEPADKGSEWYGGCAAYIMNEQHVDADEARLALVSPIYASDDELAAFPHTICITAEHDVLKHEGKRFSERLSGLSVQTDYTEMKDMSHCFFELGFERNKLSDFERDFIGSKGVAAFENGSMNIAAEHALGFIKDKACIAGHTRREH